MLYRDSKNIILQTPIDANSGGDSARTTGMLALFDSPVDQFILAEFEKPENSGLLTRHPDYYDDSCFTRDQLTCFAGGLWRAGKWSKAILLLAKRVFYSHLKRGFWCQNYRTQFTKVNKGFFGRDPMSPSDIGHLIIAAQIWWAYPFLFLSYPFLILDIIYHAKVAPREEPNQLIAKCTTHNMLWLWVWLHPNWEWSINDYWNGWRNMPEVSQKIIEGIKLELLKNED